MVYKKHSKIKKSDQHWTFLSFFNFDFWNFFNQILKAFNLQFDADPPTSFSFSDLIADNQSLVDRIKLMTNWWFVELGASFSMFTWKFSFENLYLEQLFRNINKYDLISFAIEFNQQSLILARKYLMTNQFWIYNKKKDLWVLSPEGTLILGYLDLTQLLSEVRVKYER